MPFVSPHANVEVMLLNDEHELPWIQLAELWFDSEITGERYIVPRHFRHNAVSYPVRVLLIPIIGTALFFRHFGSGVFKGFREGVLHDWLRTPDKDGRLPVPANVAHLVFREALYEKYPPDLCETYYAAVVAADRTTPTKEG